MLHSHIFEAKIPSARQEFPYVFWNL